MQQSILYRLGCLKDELLRSDKLKEEDQYCQGFKKFEVSERQATLLKVIGSLKEELLLIADIQDDKNDEVLVVSCLRMLYFDTNL